MIQFLKDFFVKPVLIMAAGMLLLSVALAWLIYDKETTVQAQVNLTHVLLWQILIWFFWIPVLTAHLRLSTRYPDLVKTTGFKVFTPSLLIATHFVWFFVISNFFSPYLDKPFTKYGVYPYFFIFWVLLDIGVVAVWGHLIAANNQSTHKPLWLRLKRGSQEFLCQTSDVHWLAAENYHTKLYTAQGEFIERKPLKFYEELLPNDVFIKVHRSTIVSLYHMKRLIKQKSGAYNIKLQDGHTRRVSRTYIKSVKKLMNKNSY